MRRMSDATSGSASSSEARAANARVRIVAGGVVKDASDILPTVIANFIANEITDFFLVFHQSNESQSRDLVETFGERARFMIYHFDDSMFRQAALTNMMIQLAHARGFDVFIPFDCDEFFVPRDSALTLSEVLSDWVRGNDSEQLLIPVLNFALPSDTEDFSAGVLRRVTHRMEPPPGVPDDKTNVRIQKWSKSIPRISGIPGAEFVNVLSGSHGSMRVTDNLRPRKNDTESPLVILHLPWRSRSATISPAHPTRAAHTSVKHQNDVAESEWEQVLDETWRTFSLDPTVGPVQILPTPACTFVPDASFLPVIERIEASGFDGLSGSYRSAVGSVQRAGVDGPASSVVVPNNDLLESALRAIDVQMKKVTHRERSRADMRERVLALRKQVRRLRQARKALRKDMRVVRQQQENRLSETPPAPTPRRRPTDFVRRLMRRF
jgi:ribosomal protein S21